MSPRTNFIKYWGKQCCLNTNLHGYKYIVLPGRVLAERFLWTVIVVVAMASALVIIFLSRSNYTKESMIFITDSINYPVWNFPFPAVTICSFNKISKLRANLQAAKIPHKLNLEIAEIADLFALLGQLYSNPEDLDQTETEKFLKLIQLLDHNKLNTNNLLRSLSPSCSSIVTRCRWKGEDKSCDMFFEKIITSEGHCCSFNYYAPKNHTFGGALYPARSPLKPRRISACGFTTSLEVLVATRPEDYFASDLQGFGNKIIVHNSYDYPDWSDQSFLLGMKVTALIGVDPSLTHSTSDLRSLSIRERACYFREEFPLLNFRYYSYQNCLTECRMNLSRYYCGCIPVIYVNEDARILGDYKVCSVRDIACLNRYRPFIRSSIPGIELEADNFSDYVWNPKNTPCECLPECSSEFYKFQASSSHLVTKHTPWTLQQGLYFGENITNHSVVRVFFNDLVGIRNRRTILGNWQTYLAFYGGVLGLFVGFSFISGIELIYFFTVKVLLDQREKARLRKKKEKYLKKLWHQKKKSTGKYFSIQHDSRYIGKMTKDNYLGYYLE